MHDGSHVEELHAQRALLPLDTSKPAAWAQRRALAALRLSLTGVGPIMESVSSRFVPGPICCDRYVPPGRSTRAISPHSTTTG